MTKEKNHAEEQAKAQLESIIEMVEALEKAEKAGDDDAIDAAREAIQEDPLEVSVRGGWHSPGEESEDEEYLILLCTGGPAVRIVGELRNKEPHTARLQYQDWGTPGRSISPNPGSVPPSWIMRGCFTSESSIKARETGPRGPNTAASTSRALGV
jgi:general stress protein YciG